MPAYRGQVILRILNDKGKTRMKLLTISVAAYNVENYLDQLMKSVICAEVMDQLEILIVDDGSKDRTPEIAAQYQDQYPESVRLITKPNGGHGSTINRGIQEASGKYFRALDGDDWVNSEHLANLVKDLNRVNSDIILSAYCACYENGRREVVEEFPELEKGKEYQFDGIWRSDFWMRYHSVIYRTDILKKHQIRLDEHCFYVDVEFMLFPIPYVDTIYYYKDDIYCYRIGLEGQSVSNQSRMKNITHSQKVGLRLIEFYLDHKAILSEQKQQYFLDEIAFHCRWHEESILLFDPNRRRKQELIAFDREIKNKSQELYGKMNEQSKATKILRLTNYHSYRLVRFLKQIKAKNN